MALPYKNRLVKKKDFDDIFKNGLTFRGNFLFIKFKKDKVNKFGFIIPARILPKAVSRNKLRRILSEVVRLGFLNNLNGYSVAVVLNKKDSDDNIATELKILLKKLSNLNE